MISGTTAPFDEFTGFDAAHILPLAHLEFVSFFMLSDESVNPLQCNNGEWGSRVQDHASNIGTTKIHSIHNGILLPATLGKEFDTYKVSINPDGFHSYLYIL